MKMLSILLLPVMFISSCTKSDMVPLIQEPIKVKWPLVVVPIPRPKMIQPVCVNSYAELVQLLGSNTVQARSVILENGMVIRLEDPVIAMTYTAVNQTGPASLFGSQFSVTHNYYGVDQTHFTDTWSLGCVYQNTVNGPFTNILKGNEIININTAIVWSIPPYNTQDLRISLIVL